MFHNKAYLALAALLIVASVAMAKEVVQKDQATQTSDDGMEPLESKESDESVKSTKDSKESKETMVSPTVPEEKKEYYPLKWTKIDFKQVIDNERLFKKYKSCLMTDNAKGCPRDIMEVKRIIPEAVDNLCAKCLPEHIEKLRTGIEYFCQKRRADYDEIKKAKDPNGEFYQKVEKTFGKINC
ncbi:hypothetical protein QAD02_001677 [Eretmocerus hayati]|uniref:Uncharacterized protein n=1 Tax=Eretmocerus hayati TaxID=131215 RepID=A0ACC2NGU6_9HYME|nr:hypothetical protein QAD02_001677 [Eretmocerus hayati]